MEEYITVREERYGDRGNRQTTGTSKTAYNKESNSVKENNNEHSASTRGLRQNFPLRHTNNSYMQTWGSNNMKDPIHKEYEKRAGRTCYICHSQSHFQASCPKVRERNGKTANVNFVEKIAQEDNFKVEKGEEQDAKEVTDGREDMCRVENIDTVKREDASSGLFPYMSKGYVNGYGLNILRDTGASIDIVASTYVKPEMYTGEYVRVRTPLQEESVCLPVAEVDVVGDFGRVFSKAAVVRSSLDRGYYLLGNKTAEIIERQRTQDPQPEILHAVTTRATKARQEIEEEEQFTDATGPTEEEEDSTEEQDTKEPEILRLVGVAAEEFRREMKQDPDMQKLREKVDLRTSEGEECVERNGLLLVKSTIG